ncbi:uncharacterized protein AAES06_003019 isoform 1-T2 [Glossophaga mutica]
MDRGRDRGRKRQGKRGRDREEEERGDRGRPRRREEAERALPSQGPGPFVPGSRSQELQTSNGTAAGAGGRGKPVTEGPGPGGTWSELHTPSRRPEDCRLGGGIRVSPASGAGRLSRGLSGVCRGLPAVAAAAGDRGGRDRDRETERDRAAPGRRRAGAGGGRGGLSPAGQRGRRGARGPRGRKERRGSEERVGSEKVDGKKARGEDGLGRAEETPGGRRGGAEERCVCGAGGGAGGQSGPPPAAGRGSREAVCGAQGRKGTGGEGSGGGRRDQTGSGVRRAHLGAGDPPPRWAGGGRRRFQRRGWRTLRQGRGPASGKGSGRRVGAIKRNQR